MKSKPIGPFLCGIGICCAIMLIQACTSRDRGPTVAIQDLATVVRGFRTFDTPRTFHPPGTILRFDTDGTDHTVIVITNSFTDLGGAEAFPEIRSTNHFTGYGFLTFLLGTAQIARVDAGATNTTRAVLSLRNAKREILGEDDYDKIIAKAIKDRRIQWRPNSKYYILMETISGTNLTASVDKDFVAKLGGEGQINAKLKAGGGVAYDRGKTFDYTRHFDSYYRVLYKPQELQVSTFGASGEVRVVRLNKAVGDFPCGF